MEREQTSKLLLHLLGSEARIHYIHRTAFRTYSDRFLAVAAVMALKDVAPLVIGHGHIAVRTLELVTAASAVEVVTEAPAVEEKDHLPAVCQGTCHALQKKRAEDTLFLHHIRNLDLRHTAAAHTVLQVDADHLRGIFHQVPGLEARGCASHEELSAAVRDALLGHLTRMITRSIAALV